MTKTRVLFILSGLWLFAIVAPSVIILADNDRTIVVSNLNEEEQQEKGKKDVDEKELFDKSLSGYLLVSNSDDCSNYAFYPVNCPGSILDIILPPPEHS